MAKAHIEWKVVAMSMRLSAVSAHVAKAFGCFFATLAIGALAMCFTPGAASAADDYEAGASSALATQAGGLAVSTTAVDFNLYPGYTQG